jgi:hypothetical protein
MDSRKYEKLMNYVINEEIEKARELFHQIVVEKSREIYESIMSEEEEMGGKVGDLLDEINAEESGMMEDDDDDDFDTETDDDLDDSDMDYEFGGIDDDESESLDDTDEQEETLIRIEDKLDELIAEFDRITKEKDDDEEDMDLDDEEDMDLDDEEDMDLDDEEDMDLDDEEDMDLDDEEDEKDEKDEDTDEVMEAVQLQKVSVTPGDNGSNKRSPVPADSGKRGMNSGAVKFAGDSEPVPNGPKSPNNFYTKGQKEVPGAGQFKNAPGHKKASLTAVPKPKHSDSGVNSKSPIAESRKARVVRAKK